MTNKFLFTNLLRDLAEKAARMESAELADAVAKAQLAMVREYAEREIPATKLHRQPNSYAALTAH